MKHTQGPWAASQYLDDGRWGVTTARVDNDSSFIIVSTRSVGLTEADARLIAAAPELLEACKTGFSTLWAMKARLIAPRNDAEKAAMDLLQQRMDVLKSAIAKAEQE